MHSVILTSWQSQFCLQKPNYTLQKTMLASCRATTQLRAKMTLCLHFCTYNSVRQHCVVFSQQAFKSTCIIAVNTTNRSNNTVAWEQSSFNWIVHFFIYIYLLAWLKNKTKLLHRKSRTLLACAEQVMIFTELS